MRIALAGDHHGVALKATLAERLAKSGHETIDLGANDTTPSDYPDWAKAVGEAVLDGRADRGVVICGSGVGACIAANKIAGIRAGLTHDVYSAHQGVEHDDMNVICIGSRIVGPALAEEIVDAFVGAEFQGHEERYVRRLNKIKELERSNR